MKKIIIYTLVFALSACQTLPVESIKPQKTEGLSCSELNAHLERLRFAREHATQSSAGTFALSYAGILTVGSAMIFAHPAMYILTLPAIGIYAYSQMQTQNEQQAFLKALDHQLNDVDKQYIRQCAR